MDMNQSIQDHLKTTGGRVRADIPCRLPDGKIITIKRLFVNGILHPDAEHEDDYIYVLRDPVGKVKIRTGYWRKKTIEEKEYDEAMKEVDKIAPGYPV